MVELLPITDTGYQQLRRNYVAVAVAGMSENSSVNPAEFLEFVEQQLTTVLEQAKVDDNAFFHSIVLSGTETAVGSLWYRLHPDSHFSDMAMIGWLGIDSQYRRRGLAKATIKLLSEQLKPQGIKTLTLEVFNSNTLAHSLYKSVGFKTDRTVMGLSI